VSVLASRIAAIPAALAEVLARPIAALDGVRTRRFVVTGGGLSEGPARYFAALLADELGATASFAALSSFAAPHPGLDGATLVLFSQGLAPNARLPLRHIHRFAQVIVLTSMSPASPGEPGALLAQVVAAGGRVETLPPPSEPGLLVRVIGGPAQVLAATQMVARPSWKLDAVPAAYLAALHSTVEPLDDTPVAVVACGRYGEYVFAFRWKLLEGLRIPDPPIWDVLGVAHGPLQQIWERPMTLIAYERQDPTDAALLARLSSVLRPHHRLLRARATLAAPLAWFEHDAFTNSLVQKTGAARGLDLASWPAMGEDGPIYDLSEVV